MLSTWVASWWPNDPGNLAEWASVVVTTLAFLAAGWVIKIELARDKRAAERESRMHQADLVAAWHDQVQVEVPVKPVMGAVPAGAAMRFEQVMKPCIRNGSALPIQIVSLSLMHNGKFMGRVATRPTVAPGDTWHGEYPKIDNAPPQFSGGYAGAPYGGTPYAGGGPPVQPSQMDLVLEFVDSRNARWRRTATNELVAVPVDEHESGRSRGRRLRLKRMDASS